MSGNSCRDALERVYEYLDGELSAGDAETIRRHFELCRECYPVLEFCKSFQDAMQRAADCQCGAPEELRARIAELLKK